MASKMVKVPAGYPRAGRWGYIHEIKDDKIIILVHSPRRVTSPRFTPAAYVEVPLSLVKLPVGYVNE